MATVKVADLLAEIQTNHKQVSASQRDEVRVMQAMLNDTSYEVGVYGKGGQIGTYNPAKDFKSMQANIVASVTKIGKDEASKLVEGYEATKSDATSMVGISKEFVNTYLSSGRKLPLGGRETSSIELEWKTIEDRISSTPVKRSDGTMERVDRFIPSHGGIKVSNSCPKWVYDRCEKENTK